MLSGLLFPAPLPTLLYPVSEIVLSSVDEKVTLIKRERLLAMFTTIETCSQRETCVIMLRTVFSMEIEIKKHATSWQQ